MDDIAAEAGVTKLILYRHFASKAELYHCALERAQALQMSALAAEDGNSGEFGTTWLRSFLDVARADPAGFELLWRHSAREPDFARYAAEVRGQAVDALLRAMPRVPEEFREWAAHAVIGYVLEAVLIWLEFGDAGRDRQFLFASSEALRAGVRAWSSGVPG